MSTSVIAEEFASVSEESFVAIAQEDIYNEGSHMYVYYNKQTYLHAYSTRIC